MNFDMTKFVEDEKKSNPMVVALRYPDCPQTDEICVGLSVGFGTPVYTCPFFKQESEDSALCTFDEKPI